MTKSGHFRIWLLVTAGVCGVIGSSLATNFDVPGGSLEAALNAYSAQSGVQLMVPADSIGGIHSRGAKGDLSAPDALSRILSGTGFTARRDSSGVVGIVPEAHSQIDVTPIQVAQAAPPRASVETVTVTSSKLGGADVQSIPIAITALSQEQLTATQTAGGPDLVKQVPNMTFTKTNFSGYSIQLRGIGTQAISVTTDPAVAIALNDIPFIRNHFFEQEFYDLSQAEVLRGPQGTLYGRNATAGVVNLVTAKPSDQFEAKVSGELGSYHQRRFEGMINLPIIDDRFDIRLAGEWTKRQGYSFNVLDIERIDGRDLWSSRLSVGWKPIESLQTTLVWEHFSENDDRMRTSKQLCHTDATPTEVGGILLSEQGASSNAYRDSNYLSQGCAPSSLFSPEAFEVPNGHTLPYYAPLSSKGSPLMSNFLNFDPYASTTQSSNLRVIETQLNPIYKAKNDTVEFSADYNVTPELTFTSQTGYNRDSLWSTQDYNRFNTAPGAFAYAVPVPGGDFGANTLGQLAPDPSGNGICVSNDATGTCNGVPTGQVCDATAGDNQCHAYGVFCDPQLGCSNRLVAQDLNTEHSWQLGQEFRLASHFAGPFNFSVGGNYLHYETAENYYVFINSLTLAAYSWTKGTSGVPVQTLPWVPGVSDNANCLVGGFMNSNPKVPTYIGAGGSNNECMYIDPNPLTSLNDKGHNYFLSQNPYNLNSYAMFGETYYNLTDEVKLTGGLRWTSDHKHFVDIPSELLIHGYGYPIAGVVNQSWNEFTGRAAINWTPKLEFTDQTLVYSSYAHGYKAGGANPPGAALLSFQNADISNPIHPLTFKPEFIDAFELGTKNTMLDGAITLNGAGFFYNYKGYQISRIVDRTSINDNFDAKVLGAELEAVYEPVPGLRFNFSGGYEHTRIADGEKSVDLMDRADIATHPDWMVVKPFPTQASNCVLPVYVVAAILAGDPNDSQGVNAACSNAYSAGLDPVVHGAYFPSWNGALDPVQGLVPGRPYYQQYDAFGKPEELYFGYPQTIIGVAPNAGTTISYAGFDPSTAPNNGQGFAKNLGGNELPNAPPFTVSAGAQYTIPLSSDWAGTLRADYYWQDYSWARVFNDNPYDRLRGYTNVNVTLILTSQDGWQVMLYDKNIFNTTQITGTFLNSDDSGLTTNVFLTDPKLLGIRVTKNW